MAKKITALILSAALILLSLTACSAQPQTQGEATTAAPVSSQAVIPNDDSTFKLSYTQADSLDPFDAVTLNNQILAQLVFESLFDLDEGFKASLNIASSYEYSDKATLKVNVLRGIKFSDGSELTAQDIKDSFNRAKGSHYWSGALDGISSCSVSSDTEIIFHLEYPNGYAHNLLTFPIVSSNSNSDYPIGSGRYYFADENGETVLKANVTDGFSPHLTTIHLENIAAEDSIDNAANIGNISFAFRDLSKNTSKKISANKKLVNMNNLVYLGVNNKSTITANAYIRKAISLAIDRQTLAKSAYGGFAQAASGVFNPQFELAGAEIIETTADINAAKQALAQSGISNLSLSILVNGSNSERVTCAKLIKQSLEDIGFSVSITQTDSDEQYFQYIASESFSLYIGETKIPNDMSLYSFFEEGGATRYGTDTQTSETAQAYRDYMNEDAQLGTFLLAFSEEMPYIPLLYRKGMICFSKAMNGDMQGTYFDCFANIENWYFKSE